MVNVLHESKWSDSIESSVRLAVSSIESDPFEIFGDGTRYMTTISAKLTSGMAVRLSNGRHEWLADEPVSARRETLTERVGRWMRRPRTWTRAVAVIDE